MNEGELMIYGQIGGEVPAVGFLEQLRNLGDVDKITVRINSKGGSVFDGYAIYNALTRHKAHVRVEIDGIAASAASYIAMAGDEILISENAEIMVHCGMVGIDLANYFNAAELENRLIPELGKVATALKRIDNQIAGMYAARTGHKHETWMRLMEKETTFTAEEAVKKGLADAMIPNKSKPAEKPKQRMAAESRTDLSSLAAVAEQINRELPEFVTEVPEIDEQPCTTWISLAPQPDIGDGGPTDEELEAAKQAKLAEYAARAAEVQA